MRTLLSETKFISKTPPEESSSYPSGCEALTSNELRPGASAPSCSRHAVLWNFLDESTADTSIFADEYDLEQHGQHGYVKKNDGSFQLDFQDLETLAPTRKRSPIEISEVYIQPPPLSTFPQLSTPKEETRHCDQDFWARMPVEVVRSVQTPVTEVELLDTLAHSEPFPQLCIPKASINYTGQDFWAKMPVKATSLSQTPILKVKRPEPKAKRSNRLAKKEPFPQLGIPKASVRDADQQFWSKRAVEVVPSIGTPVPKVKHVSEVVKTEPFPRLGRLTPTSKHTDKDFWARFSKDERCLVESEVQPKLPHDEEHSKSVSGHKKSKRRQWASLAP